jgi:hypothetical protein
VGLLAQVFDSEGSRPDRGTEIERLRTMIADTGTAPEVRQRGPAAGGAIPVPECLRPLIPSGMLQRGTVVAVPPRVAPTGIASAGYVELALLAGATAGGAWAAAIGHPSLGISAAAGLGADLSKVLLLDQPGDRWADAVAVLADAVDLILLHPPRRPTEEQLRRISSRIRETARQRGTALLVTGFWESAHLNLHQRDPHWVGLGDGTGHLAGRRVTVASDGRAAHGRRREVELWLPAADGTMSAYTAAADDRRPSVEHGPARLRIA